MAQINKRSEYFNTVLYTGNGSTQSITGVGFQPDWIWLKGRSAISDHKINDVIRGTDAYLSSNNTAAEDTTGSGIQSYDSDGFSLSNASNINDNSVTYASWNWLADNTSGSSNTDGSITSTVSANTTSGFSIVSYTGNGTANATVGHGLGVTPNVIWFKRRDSSNNWINYFSELGTDNYLTLNLTNASSSAGGAWCTPSSSTFQLNQVFSATNTNTATYIAYCFAEKKGFSKFGSYTGNGNADGTFVYTGFKPAFVMVKPTVTADNWVMFDNKRLGYNPDNNFSYANKDFAENDADIIDLLSNGFKQRSSGGTSNRSGEPFIYMAFAESPLVGTNNIPATAR